jgi:hypothetical protein
MVEKIGGWENVIFGVAKIHFPFQEPMVTVAWQKVNEILRGQQINMVDTLLPCSRTTTA